MGDEDEGQRGSAGAIWARLHFLAQSRSRAPSGSSSSSTLGRTTGARGPRASAGRPTTVESAAHAELDHDECTAPGGNVHPCRCRAPSGRSRRVENVEMGTGHNPKHRARKIAGTPRRFRQTDMPDAPPVPNQSSRWSAGPDGPQRRIRPAQYRDRRHRPPLRCRNDADAAKGQQKGWRMSPWMSENLPGADVSSASGNRSPDGGRGGRDVRTREEILPPAEDSM